MEKPTVLLIGGAPLIGTGVVAREIAGRWRYSCLGTEDVVLAVTAVTTAQSHPQFHLLEQKDHRRYFVTNTVSRMAADTRYRSESAWPSIKKVIECHIEEAVGIVVEGWALLPDRIAELDRSVVRSLWLAADESLFQQRLCQERQMFESDPMEDVFARKFAARSAMINDDMRKAAQALDMPIVEVTSGKSVEEITEECVRMCE